MRKIGRILHAAYPLVLVATLVFVGVFLANFTTEQSSSDLSQHDVATIHPNQTYLENVTIAYENLDPSRLFSIRHENDSIVIVLHCLTNTLNSWNRLWLPFTIQLNDTGDVHAAINRTLEGPEGVIEPEGHMYFGTNEHFIIANPEVTQGGTYRLSLQSMGSQDIHPIITWQVESHHYEKPYPYYGITVLALASVLTAIFLTRKFGPWKPKPQMKEETTTSNTKRNQVPLRHTRQPFDRNSIQTDLNHHVVILCEGIEFYTPTTRY